MAFGSRCLFLINYGGCTQCLLPLFPNAVLPVIGKPNWFLITLLAPYAGIYYWRSGDRVDDCTFKLESDDAETENTITVQGSEEELDRMWRTLEWREKGKIKVPGLLDTAR